MGLLKWLTHKKNGTPNLVGNPIRKVIGPKKKTYKTHCLLMFNGEPIRKFDTNVRAYSSSTAEQKVKEGLSISVVKTYKTKSK